MYQPRQVDKEQDQVGTCKGQEQMQQSNSENTALSVVHMKLFTIDSKIIQPLGILPSHLVQTDTKN